MMRKVLATVQMDGVVVIGEGEKDVRPLLATSQCCCLSLSCIVVSSFKRTGVCFRVPGMIWFLLLRLECIL